MHEGCHRGLWPVIQVLHTKHSHQETYQRRMKSRHHLCLPRYRQCCAVGFVLLRIFSKGSGYITIDNIDFSVMKFAYAVPGCLARMGSKACEVAISFQNRVSLEVLMFPSRSTCADDKVYLCQESGTEEGSQIPSPKTRSTIEQDLFPASVCATSSLDITCSPSHWGHEHLQA